MYAGVVQIPVTTHTDFVEGVRTETRRLFPAVVGQAGFRGGVVLMERAARSAIGIGLWDSSREAGEAVRATGAIAGFEAAAGFAFEQGLTQWRVVRCEVDAAPSFLGEPTDAARPGPLARVARVIYIRGRPGSQFLEEARETLRILLPFTAELPGYLGGIALVDPQAGSGLTISLWASEDDRRRAAERARGAATAGTIALETDPDATTIESWEVVALDVRATLSLDDPLPG